MKKLWLRFLIWLGIRVATPYYESIYDSEDPSFADKVTRVAAAIQRAGGDFKGDVTSIHRDFLDLLKMIPPYKRGFKNAAGALKVVK